MEHLTKQQESFCENAGIFGTLISITCLIQHFIFMLPHWITFSIAAVYLLCIISFILLAKKNAAAPLLLAICGGLVLALEILLTVSLAFSLILVILLIYLVIITAILYGGAVAVQLKKRKAFLKEEAAKWDNII